MGTAVVVVSGDGIRGRILREALRQGGFHVRWFSGYFEAEEAMLKEAPHVLILDTKGYTTKKIPFLDRIRHDFPETAVVVLGEGRTIAQIEGAPMYGVLGLGEPLDPGLIVSKVSELGCGAERPEKRARDACGERGEEHLARRIKEFLKLR